MKAIEKIQIERPEKLSPASRGGVIGCPDDYFTGAACVCLHEVGRHVTNEMCVRCWAQEVTETWKYC